jgi:hypothetical protein
MSGIHNHSALALSDRTHTWTDPDGIVCSVLDLGAADILFDSADEARKVAARCLDIADAIDAKTAELAARSVS